MLERMRVHCPAKKSPLNGRFLVFGIGSEYNPAVNDDRYEDTMNQLLLALATLSFSSSVAAAWVTFMKTDTSVVYIDSTTVRKEGNLRKAEVLVDLIRKEADGVQSKRGQSEIDCLEDRMRIHDLSGFSGNMASGEAVYSFKGASEWMPIPPNSALWNTIKQICAR